MPNIGPMEVMGLLLYFGVICVAAYIVGQRRGVPNAGLAFIPLIGPWIVILRSIARSGWMSILAVIPLVSLVFGVWLAFAVPSRHSRTAWWGAAFIIPVVNVVAFWVYAFTLPEERPTPLPSEPALAASPTPASAVTGDRLSLLHTLADLRDRGALSEDEFRAEKARLLGAE